MTTGRLAKLNAIVTGASGGLGTAIVARFEAEGAKVIAIDARQPANTSNFVQCDVGVPADVERAMSDALSRLDGRLDILVTAAALTGGRAPFPDVTDAEWQDYIGINLGGTFFTCRAAATAMIAGGRGGSIITVGSVNSVSAEASASAYASSKGGVAMLTKAMAVDLAPQKIRANMIAPGPVEVPRNTAIFQTDEFRRGFAKHVPMGVPGQPEDVANAAVFLAEPASRMITGTTLVIDGGVLARIPSFSIDD